MSDLLPALLIALFSSLATVEQFAIWGTTQLDSEAQQFVFQTARNYKVSCYHCMEEYSKQLHTLKTWEQEEK